MMRRVEEGGFLAVLAGIWRDNGGGLQIAILEAYRRRGDGDVVKEVEEDNGRRALAKC